MRDWLELDSFPEESAPGNLLRGNLLNVSALTRLSWGILGARAVPGGFSLRKKQLGHLGLVSLGPCEGSGLDFWRKWATKSNGLI